MKNVNSLISERMKKGTPNTKMSAMAELSASGQMTSFGGLFSVTVLSDPEKASLLELLSEYAQKEDLSADLKELSLITSEVKAINNQAAMLHGERIKKAQTLLKSYREGAFTAWLIATYGNRQTPYNLLQYYEFYETLPSHLRSRLEEMPRQAIYSLASRTGSFELKLKLIENYQGETKQTLLARIRELFPLAERDQRKQNLFQTLISTLEKGRYLLRKTNSLTRQQKSDLQEALKHLKSILDPIKVRS